MGGKAVKKAGGGVGKEEEVRGKVKMPPRFRSKSKGGWNLPMLAAVAAVVIAIALSMSGMLDAQPVPPHIEPPRVDARRTPAAWEGSDATDTGEAEAEATEPQAAGAASEFQYSGDCISQGCEPGATCVDVEDSCRAWALGGECGVNPVFMNKNCNASCGLCGGPSHRAPAPERLANSLQGKCRDDSPNCAQWAGAGECENNPGFMHEQCPLSCNTCPDKDSNPACKRPNETAAVTEGGISAMFERALREFPQYSPRALSREPWVMTFDNFISDEEAEQFINLCSAHFERSMAGDQLSPVRTSHQCWCSHPKCEHDPIVKRVTDRIGSITMTPAKNAEYFQVVRYEPGQFYKVHHDQNSAPFTPQGARLYTFFMYLSTPEAGGTKFNDLGITVNATKGSAVLWPSIMDEDNNLPELRTHHEALPPTAGLKFGANLWIHQYDFKTPSTRRCELTFKNTYDPEAQLPNYNAARRKAGKDDSPPLTMTNEGYRY